MYGLGSNVLFSMLAPFVLSTQNTAAISPHNMILGLNVPPDYGYIHPNFTGVFYRLKSKPHL